MLDGLKGMGDLMKLVGQAGKIKENVTLAHERARTRTATAEAGAGMVKVTVNGVGEIISVAIDQEAVKDLESLGPLLVSAVNLALAKGKEIMMEETKTAMDGLGLPPGML